MKVTLVFFILVCISYNTYSQHQDCFYLLVASTEREVQTESTQGSQDLDCAFGNHVRPSITYNDYHEIKIVSGDDTITCLNFLNRSVLWIAENPEHLNLQIYQSKLNSQLHYSGKICGDFVENDLVFVAKNTKSYSLDDLLITNMSFAQNHLPQAIYSGTQLSWTIPNLKIQCHCLIENNGTLNCNIQANNTFRD